MDVALTSARSGCGCHHLPYASRFPLVASLLLFLGTLPAFSQVGHPVAGCEGLAKLALPGTTITMARSYASGEFEVPSQRGPGGTDGPGAQTPALCRVGATLKPTGDSDIKIEIWLPLAGWNGKFLGAGNMGWAGAIPYGSMLSPVRSGYAVAGTDTGHVGGSGAFVIGHPEKFIDYGYRADHLMTVVAKSVIAAYYGTPPSKSYWVGCSLGGEEGLQEASRYPADYDGIVAGAPVNPLSRLNAAQLWPAWVSYKFPDEAIPGPKFVMIHQAALKACASPVGQRQGFVDDPDSCHFDPGVLLCKDGDASDCLTAPQLHLLRKFYQGPVNPRTGESIFPGMPIGGELQWAQDNGGAKPIGVAVDLYRYAVYQDPNWDWKTLDYDTAIAKAVKEVDPILYAAPNLNGFFDRGGKLMLYIGASEYHSFLDLENYYNIVAKNAGPAKKDQARLFVVDGMGHCAGGPGADTFEKLGTIDAWAETGKAPEQLLSSRIAGGKTLFTRPLCAYPTVARYKGEGAIKDAANFVCKK